MYPFIKLLTTLIKAKYRKKISLHEKSVVHFRAGITDIDMFMELNNARYFSTL